MSTILNNAALRAEHVEILVSGAPHSRASLLINAFENVHTVMAFHSGFTTIDKEAQLVWHQNHARCQRILGFACHYKELDPTALARLREAVSDLPPCYDFFRNCLSGVGLTPLQKMHLVLNRHELVSVPPTTVAKAQADHVKALYRLSSAIGSFDGSIRFSGATPEYDLVGKIKAKYAADGEVLPWLVKIKTRVTEKPLQTLVLMFVNAFYSHAFDYLSTAEAESHDFHVTHTGMFPDPKTLQPFLRQFQHDEALQTTYDETLLAKIEYIREQLRLAQRAILVVENVLTILQEMTPAEAEELLIGKNLLEVYLALEARAEARPFQNGDALRVIRETDSLILPVDEWDALLHLLEMATEATYTFDAIVLPESQVVLQTKERLTEQQTVRAKAEQSAKVEEAERALSAARARPTTPETPEPAPTPRKYRKTKKPKTTEQIVALVNARTLSSTEGRSAFQNAQMLAVSCLHHMAYTHSASLPLDVIALVRQSNLCLEQMLTAAARRNSRSETYVSHNLQTLCTKARLTLAPDEHRFLQDSNGSGVATRSVPKLSGKAPLSRAENLLLLADLVLHDTTPPEDMRRLLFQELQSYMYDFVALFNSLHSYLGIEPPLGSTALNGFVPRLTLHDGEFPAELPASQPALDGLRDVVLGLSETTFAGAKASKETMLLHLMQISHALRQLTIPSLRVTATATIQQSTYLFLEEAAAYQRHLTTTRDLDHDFILLLAGITLPEALSTEEAAFLNKARQRLHQARYSESRTKGSAAAKAQRADGAGMGGPVKVAGEEGVAMSGTALHVQTNLVKMVLHMLSIAPKILHSSIDRSETASPFGGEVVAAEAKEEDEEDGAGEVEGLAEMVAASLTLEDSERDSG
ncbi:MAG: hypothetical protein SP1CHLAM54_04040 [Chlamydiia bacterium]|nr:hypothetical protein [Chlamydiia bacterium]MCH9615319.1 hypothetical protein [Chlamydiia bacterium]MCH9628359.1 hypothetical protein [Chlamydiia bacterium]